MGTSSSAARYRRLKEDDLPLTWPPLADEVAIVRLVDDADATAPTPGEAKGRPSEGRAAPAAVASDRALRPLAFAVLMAVATIAATLVTGAIRSGTAGRGPTTGGPAETTPAPAVTPPEQQAAGTMPARLAVRTEPPGAAVSIDGRPHGKSPVVVRGVAPGEHTVTVQERGARVEQRVTVGAGESVTLVVTLSPASRPPESGTLVVKAPVEVRLLEEGRLLGTSEMSGVSLEAGSHDITFVSDAVGYRETRTVTVAAGTTTAITVELPKVTLAVNATPWAEVWVDGVPAGATPIGNLEVAPGPHTILLRHPRLGERRISTLVKVNEPQRLAVDLSK